MTDTSTLLTTILGGSGLLTAIVATYRAAGMSSRWAALSSIGTGVTLALLASVAAGTTDTQTLAGAALAGLTAGLTASGLYSGTKATTESEAARAARKEAEAGVSAAETGPLGSMEVAGVTGDVDATDRQAEDENLG